MLDKQNKRSYFNVLFIVYVTMLIFGMMENIKGVSFPLIKAEFNVSYDLQGALVSFSWFGYVVFCMIATMSIQKFGSKKSLLFGYILIGLGCILTPFAPNFLTIIAALTLIWMGFGFFEVGTNAIATTTFTSNSAIFMGLLHFFYGFGAIIGPKISGVVINSYDVGFREIYLFAFFPVLMILIYILFSHFNIKEDNDDEKDVTPAMTIKTALANPDVWLFACTLGFMEVIEFGAANWGGLYLKDVFGLNPATIGATFVSVFYILFTLSRLFTGPFIEKIGYVKSIVWSLSFTALLYLIGFSMGQSGIWVLTVTGFFIAILWPTLMCVAMLVFKKNSAIATSVIIVISGTINGIFQLLVGVINEHIGYAWGYRSNTIYALIPLVLILIIKRRNLNEDSTNDSPHLAG